MTAQGIVHPLAPLPKGVPANFHLKREAEFCFLTGAPFLGGGGGPMNVPKKLGNQAYEKEYREYYDELVTNEAEWMEFFDYRGNFEHAE